MSTVSTTRFHHARPTVTTYVKGRRTPIGRFIEIAEVPARLTIAYRTEGTQVTYGVAFCALSDNFCKATGRAQAEADLFKSPFTVELTGSEGTLETIYADIAANHLPTRWIAVRFPERV